MMPKLLPWPSLPVPITHWPLPCSTKPFNTDRSTPDSKFEPGHTSLHTRPVPSVYLTSFCPSHYQHLEANHPHILPSTSTCSVHNRLKIKKPVHISRYHCKSANNMKNQASIFSSKYTSLIEILDIENYLDEPQNIEFKKNNHSLHQRIQETERR